jgi:hypothetical protein
VVVVTLAEATRDVVANTSADEEETASAHRRRTLSHFDDVRRLNDGSLGFPKTMKRQVIRFHLRLIS